MKIPAIDSWTRERKDAARAILLEKSPFAVDGGELIGRDPRQIPAGKFDRAGLVAAPILEVIRAKCMDCCAEQSDEVRKCVSVLCPNWPYRMGTNPLRTVNLTSEERERRSEHGKAVMAALKARGR
jgi:hypothetical protein